MTTIDLPSEVEIRVLRFLEEQRTGSVRFDIKAGQVLACEIVERVRPVDTEGRGSA